MNENDPTVQQKTQPPTGNIPKGRQAWFMIGVAVVIVLAVVFTGSTGSTPKTAVMPAMQVNTTSKTEIDRYTSALRQEEARLKLAQDQAARARTDYAAMNAHANNAIPGQGVVGPDGQAYYPATGQPTPAVDPLEQARLKREYDALFASNVALSYRKEQAPAVVTSTLTPVSATVPPAVSSPVEPPAAIATGGHLLFEGTILEAALTNRLEGGFAGPVNCQLTTNVYSRDQQTLLIPQGSRILGEAKRVEDRDQQRLAVCFHRLIMPDGYSVNLDVIGLDQAGESALKDKVNHHYLSTFGTSIALGLLAGFSMYGTGGVLTADGSDIYRQGVANQLGRDSTRILDRQLNRMPTITIREGHRVKILLSKDLRLPSYKDHKEPIQ